MPRLPFALALALALTGCELLAGFMRGEVALPRREAFDPSHFERLTLPEGFAISLWARDLGNVRNIAFGPDGALYATRRGEGDVLRLRDTDGDGYSDERTVVASGLKQVNGIAIHGGKLYLAPPTQVLTAEFRPDGGLGPLTPLVTGLPEGKQHPNRTLAIGPDGALYLTVGSSCNDCDEKDERYATVMRGNADGTGLRVFARGLRNTIGFDWHPRTGDLWGMDHGSDWRGPDAPPEELNRLVDGGHYGWPFCYASQKVDPQTKHVPPGGDAAAFCAETVPPALTYQAHSAPLDLVFYNGAMFPEAYKHDAFVTMHGSWNRERPTGYKLVRIRFEEGWPVKAEDFITGFLAPDGQSQFGRPCGLAVAPDGSLFMTDDSNGMIYQISYAASGPQ